MDGLLIVNKPAGPSSHEAVVRVRRVLGERRIGHTGTLDPAASGVLPMVLGRATRLSRFLSGADKTYEADIRLGFATTTFDAHGAPAGALYEGPWPEASAVEAALDAFRGVFVQQPPAYSAKKIGGRRSYDIARRAERGVTGGSLEGVATPAPVAVRTSAIEILRTEGELVVVRVCCSAGFYVRSLAHDLGQRLGTGAHLRSLRRTSSGDMTIERAITLAALEDREQGRTAAEKALVPLDRMLADFEAVVLTSQGIRRAVAGCELGPADAVSGFDGLRVTPGPTADRPVRLLSEGGSLVAIGTASRASGLLHPLVVLM
jgi:tRNA pseudouridine55 synthase